MNSRKHLVPGDINELITDPFYFKVKVFGVHTLV